MCVLFFQEWKGIGVEKILFPIKLLRNMAQRPSGVDNPQGTIRSPSSTQRRLRRVLGD